MIIVDLHRQLQLLKCGEDDNMHTHFDIIANLCEQLAVMGTTIPDDKYASILLGSIPSTYKASTSTMSTTAALTNTMLTSNNVICLLTDEYDCQVPRKPKNEEGQDEALTADGGKKKKLKKDLECFNCHKCSHIKADGWAKGSGKEGQGPRKRAQDGTVSAKQQQVQPNIEAWAVIENPFNEDTWTIVKEAADPNVRTEKEQTNSEAWTVIEEALDKEEKDQTNFTCKPHTKSKLYNSGVSCHMSPFRQQFMMFCSIPLCPIMAADKWMFYANGIGDLQIHVPNGKSFMPAILSNTLYAPEMALTVVSISQIMKAGFAVLFEGNTCKIKNRKGVVVGTIPASVAAACLAALSRSLYLI